jgi:aminomethyltransferase
MKKTFLFDTHVSLGAKMAPFGGFEMPIQYEGILAEHFATRKSATVFDTCHMGEFMISGPNAVKDLDNVLSCPVASMKTGQCRYGFICNNQGGIIDDQILYRLSENEFFMIVNASTQDSDFEWINEHVSTGTLAKNLSKETGKLDVQGPLSAQVINKLLKKSLSELPYYHWMYNEYDNKKVIVSRTGYTGEIGFEIYCDESSSKRFWDDCLSLGVKPAGLGARDTLRLEMGYPLYGHELDSQRNAAESGFTRAIASDKEFIGSKVIHDPGKATSLLCGIKLDGRKAARHNDLILSTDKVRIGCVTSGSFSPSLGYAIAMGYIGKTRCAPGTNVVICTSSHELTGTIVAMPFYKEATARKNITDFL